MINKSVSFALIGLVALISLLTTSCTQQETLLKKVAQEALSTDEPILAFSFQWVGPVEYVSTMGIAKGSWNRGQTPLLKDTNEVFLTVRVTPVRFTEGEHIFVSVLVKAKDSQIVLGSFTLIWSATELTSPTKPSPTERDVRVLEAYESALSSYPPTKTVTFILPAYDIAVASVLGQVALELQDDDYKASSLDLYGLMGEGTSAYPKDRVWVQGLKEMFDEFLYFDMSVETIR